MGLLYFVVQFDISIFLRFPSRAFFCLFCSLLLVFIYRLEYFFFFSCSFRLVFFSSFVWMCVHVFIVSTIRRTMAFNKHTNVHHCNKCYLVELLYNAGTRACAHQIEKKFEFTTLTKALHFSNKKEPSITTRRNEQSTKKKLCIKLL